MLYQLVNKVRAALDDRKGITALEYGILAAAIVGVVATAAAGLGTEIATVLDALTNNLKNAASGL